MVDDLLQEVWTPFSSLYAWRGLRFRLHKPLCTCIVLYVYTGSVNLSIPFLTQLESGEVGLHLDLGSGQESVFASGHHLNDSQRHNVSVTRSGLDVTLTVDSYTTQYTLSSSELTLEIDSAEIYTGGSPYTSSGFTGCLQDVRLNQFSLPTSGSNRFASVTIEGGTGVIEGCSLGPCFPHPCGSGLCEETSDTSYECVCPDGSRRLSECPDTVQQSDNLAYIVGGSVLGFLLVLSLVTISGEHHSSTEPLVPVHTYIGTYIDEILLLTPILNPQRSACVWESCAVHDVLCHRY